MAVIPNPSRGEIWLIDFDPSIGAEIRKIRPAVVINLDSIGRLPLRLIVPVTEWKPQYSAFPWFTELTVDSNNGLIKDSGADAFQVKSVSLARFVRKLGVVTSQQLNRIASTVALCVGAP
jgi:mRNA interferase MazF